MPGGVELNVPDFEIAVAPAKDVDVKEPLQHLVALLIEAFHPGGAVAAQ